MNSTESFLAIFTHLTIIHWSSIRLHLFFNQLIIQIITFEFDNTLCYAVLNING